MNILSQTASFWIIQSIGSICGVVGYFSYNKANLNADHSWKQPLDPEIDFDPRTLYETLWFVSDIFKVEQNPFPFEHEAARNESKRFYEIKTISQSCWRFLSSWNSSCEF